MKTGNKYNDILAQLGEQRLAMLIGDMGSTPIGVTMYKKTNNAMKKYFSFSLILIVLSIFSCTSSKNRSDTYHFEISNTKFIFKKISSGEFQMGSEYYKIAKEEEQKYFIDESPIHKVAITKEYWVSESEVSVEQFEKFVSETKYITDAEKIGESLGEYSIIVDSTGKKLGSWIIAKGLNWKSTGFPISNNQPVVYISWNDANEFCKWLSKKSGKEIRLLTEAEWEYAAGGKQGFTYSWGDSLPTNLNGGNIADSSFKNKFHDWRYPVYELYNDNFIFPSPVKSYSENKNGLFDMTGNVWEWTSDFYSKDYYSNSTLENPTGFGSGEEHTIRGGGFDWELSYLRISKRRHLQSNKTACNLGFRICFN